MIKLTFLESFVHTLLKQVKASHQHGERFTWHLDHPTNSFVIWLNGRDARVSLDVDVTPDEREQLLRLKNRVDTAMSHLRNLDAAEGKNER